MAKRYQPSELIGEQGGVQTFFGRDVVNGLPVRLYSFMGEPTSREGELKSEFIPPLLSSSFSGAAGEVVSAFSGEFKKTRGAVAPGQVKMLLLQTAAALDDAAKAGVVHGDLSPERIFFDREAGEAGRFVLEGYGVPWPVRPSEFSAPERIGGASFAGDIFSWARTVKHLSGPLPGDLRDLLDPCLDADPDARPHAREVRAALEQYPFGGAAPKPNPQASRDTSAFESYAADYVEDDSDAKPDDNPGLTLPPKTFKVKEYQRQLSAPTNQPTVQPAAPPLGAASETPSQPGVSESGSALAAAPTMPAGPPPTRVRLVSSPKPPHPADLLSQLDATESYKARLAAYNAKHAPNVQGEVHNDARNDVQTRIQNRDTSATMPPTSAPAAATPAAPAVRPIAPPRVRVQPLSNPNDAARAATSSSASRDEPDFDDAFEVDDDINDRAPDPTLYRGGRRVFLLTLLGIALLVLLALQLINA